MAEARSTEILVDDIKPPRTSVGVIGWLKANLFNSWFNSLLTLLIMFAFYKIVPPFVRWAFIDSLWTSTGEECLAADGACWSIIPSNIRFILFGFYPYDEQWRPAVAIAMLVSLLIYSQYRRNWKKNLFYIWIGGLVVMGILMKGGLLGLSPVETTKWGGLPLTLLLSVFGLTAA